MEENNLEIEALKKLADDNLNLAKYQKAEFENYKKRNNESIANAFDDGKIHAIRVVLPLLDALLEARNIMKDPADIQGLDMLIRKFETGITALGLTEIPTDGKFDPHMHNAIATEPVEGTQSDTIIATWQKGYMMGKKIIRPATVKVAS